MPSKGDDDTGSLLSLPSPRHPQELCKGGECCEGVLTRAIGACRICNGRDDDAGSLQGGNRSTGSQKRLPPWGLPRGECAVAVVVVGEHTVVDLGELTSETDSSTIK